MVTQDETTLHWSTPCTRSIIQDGSALQEQEDYNVPSGREGGKKGGKEGGREWIEIWR